MHAHSLKCPIYFDPMFFKADGTDYTEEEWKNVGLSEVMSMVTYELFYDRTDAKEELLDSIETLPDGVKKYMNRILEPVSDKDYVHTWSGTGTLSPRILLYPAGHMNRRLKDEENFKNRSDLTFFLSQLKPLGIRITRNQDATITLGARVGGQLAHLKPCCPRCHTILPDKWFNSAGYYKISLLAPPLGGKTTLLSSWMIHDYHAIRSMGFSNNNFSAVYGLARGDMEFEIQKYFREAADTLCHTGQYPGRDEPSRKPPLYTRIIHYTDEINPETGKKEEYLIVGSYDIAGETLKNLQSGEISPELIAYLNYMDAYIYLISPSQLSGLSRIITDERKGRLKGRRKDTAGYERNESSAAGKFHMDMGNEDFIDQNTGRIRVLSLEEQAEYQRNSKRSEETVSAMELLTEEEGSTEKFAPWDIFHKVDTLLINEGTKTDAHMAYTIVKCDQIMDLPEIADTANVEILFNNPADIRAMDDRYILQNGMEVKKILSRFAVQGAEQRKKDFISYLSNTDSSRGGFRSVSWHCVSANIEESTKEYQSIRRTDPLVGCLLSEFKRLGWN